MAVRDFSALTNVSVVGGQFKFDDGADIAGSKFNSVDSGIKVIETKYGYLTATDAAGVYDFTALSGGEFQFKDVSDASVGAFDGSGVAYGIKVSVDNAGKTKELKTVLTGDGKDVVEVASVAGGTFDLGAGKDTISFDSVSGATVSLGEGADLISVNGSGASTITVSDYNYADGDKISVTGAAKLLDFDFDNGVATAGINNQASVVATTTLNNGVYELSLNDYVFVRTNVSSVNYVATEDIDFVSNGDTTTLDLKLAGDGTDTNNVSVGATEGTVNIIAGKAKASIDVGADVDFSLGIEKKGAAVTVKHVLDADDTLYLMDGSKISDVKFYNDGGLQYGAASVAGAYNAAAEGTFKYNINGEEGVLAYGNAGGAVTYVDGVTYYANASTVNASEYEGELILNLNGVCGDAFNANVSVVSGVVSGLVAGRDKENTIINLATEEGNKTEVYGGVAGNDSINLNGVDDGSTNVIWYSNGDGNDTVYGFTNGDNTVYFHDAAAAAGVLNDVASFAANGALKIAMDKKNVLTLDSVKAAGGETNVVNFKDAVGNTFKVAVGDGNDVTYDSEVNIYKGATTLKVDGEEDRIIWTGASNDEYGYYDDIKAIDAGEASGTLYLSGTDVSGMSITGGTGVNHMWGGGAKGQTLVGNDDAVDVFWFGAGDGRDVANDAGADDGVNLYNVENINDVVIKTSSNYFTVTIGNDSLKVSLAGGTTAEDALKTFTFANNAGVLYTYDTESKTFQQK